MGGRHGAKTSHTEYPDGAAELGSASSPGERCPAVLAAAPAGNPAAGAAVTARGRISTEGPRVREEVGLLDTVCWPCREPGLAGGQELLLGHWSAALASSLLGDSQNPLTRDSEATPSPLILDAFAHPSPPLSPQTRAPARGELITSVT